MWYIDLTRDGRGGWAESSGRSWNVSVEMFWNVLSVLECSWNVLSVLESSWNVLECHGMSVFWNNMVTHW